MAYRLLHYGKHKDTYRQSKKDVPVLLCKINDEPVVVTHKQVKDYTDDDMFLKVLSIYNYTKLWGMPNGNGWANEPVEVLEGISAIELEAKAIEYEEMEDVRRDSAARVPSNRRK